MFLNTFNQPILMNKMKKTKNHLLPKCEISLFLKPNILDFTDFNFQPRDKLKLHIPSLMNTVNIIAITLKTGKDKDINLI